MATFLPIRSDRRLFNRPPIIVRLANRLLAHAAHNAESLRRAIASNSTRNHTWKIRWFIKSWLVPAAGSIGFVFMFAWAALKWWMES
ncbi:hypothetical protein [Candidatus Nitrotoga sp. M5]|uniref:hypothetical protein n=1 Tax=Candidatus Nitrotoga sp. M5 TaxID=2890409 RepID=UPI001EF613E0|nr:hypothetical protein [Candidatus Nitrotoga sp. M5]CAH1387054.1 hypothetical protein NTGM5_480050 [Candidatus Nitrotoga sp. M5]